MNRLSFVLFAALAAVILGAVLFLTPYVRTGLDPNPQSGSGGALASTWIFQDRVDYVLWKLSLRQDPPFIYYIDLIQSTVRAGSWDEISGVPGTPGMKIEMRQVMVDGECRTEIHTE